MLLTADDVVRRAHYRNAQRTLYRLLELGAVPVVNENDTVATDEIRFGDNDRLAALVAHLVHADLLVLLSDVDGLYDADPHRAGRDADRARSAARPTWPASRLGDAGRRGRRHRRHGHQGRGRPDRHRRRHPGRCSTAADTVDRGAGRRDVGTWFRPTGRRTAHPAALAGPRGRPARAAGARRRRGRGRRRAARLAAAGRHHRRRRRASSPATRSTWSTKTATWWPAGWSTSTPAELPPLLGRSTRDLARELGPAYEREVVHRDDLVLHHRLDAVALLYRRAMARADHRRRRSPTPRPLCRAVAQRAREAAVEPGRR